MADQEYVCDVAGCGRKFAKKNYLSNHKRMKHGSEASTVKEPSAATFNVGAEPGKGFYSPLEQMVSTPKGPAAGAVPVPAIFDTTGLWMALGDMLDKSILKDRPGKINMTEEKAKMLHESMTQSGFTVQPNPHPVQVPWWFPFVATVLSVIILPLAAAYLPAIILRIRASAKAVAQRLQAGRESQRVGESEGATA